MVAEDLWSDADEVALGTFRRASATDDLAGALFAIDGVPAPVAARDRALLDEWARQVSRKTVERNPGVQAWALAGVLGGEIGFRLDDGDFYAPENGHLHQVLARHRGLPILLSAVWIEVGKRARAKVEGIALPGHFVARVGGEAGILVDPAAGGRSLTPGDCRRLVHSHARAAWHDEYLEATPTDAVLERVLHNLVKAHDLDGDVRALYRAVRFLAALRPQEPGYLLDRAAIAVALGDLELAAAVFAETARRFPLRREGQLAARQAADLAGKKPLPN
jgi:regulator of sirC expression with transglutaminase-like and TPR domain